MNDALLILRSLRFYVRPLTAAAALMLLITAAFVGISAVKESAVNAVKDSVRSGYGDKKYAVQVRDPEKSLPTLAADRNLEGIADFSGSLSTGDRLVNAEIRLTEPTRMSLGVVVDGTAPRRDGEAALSVAAADTLGVSVGAAVRSDTGEGGARALTVTGLVVDPADRASHFAHVVVPHLAPGEVSVWVSDKDPFSAKNLSPLFDQEALTGRTVELLAEDEAADARHRSVMSAEVVQVAVATTAVWLLLLMLPFLGRLAQPGLRGLEAAGMTRRRAQRVSYVCLAITVGSGVILGYVIAVMGVEFIARERLAAAMGQYWSTPSVPLLWPALFTVGLALAVIGAVGARGLVSPVLLSKIRAVAGRRRTSSLATATLTCIAASMLALSFVPLTLQGWVDPSAAFPVIAISTLTAVLTTPAAMTLLLVRLRAGSAWSAALEAMGPSLVGLSTAITILAFVAAAYTARAVHDDRSSATTGGGAQPVGTLAVYQAPDAQAEQLALIYRELGGTDPYLWQLPDETAKYLRVTQPSVLACMNDREIPDPFLALDACDDGGDAEDERLGAQIEIVAFDPGAEEQVVAAPKLVQGDRLGIIQFDDSNGEVAQLATTEAATRDFLGGNLPGALIQVDGRIAKEFNLHPSGASMLYFPDFGEQKSDVQAAFRRSVARLAGAAQIAEDNPQIQGARTRFAWSVGIVAAAFLALLGCAGSVAIRRLSAPVALTGLTLGVPRQRSLRFAVEMYTVIAVPTFVGAGWGVFIAWVVGVKDTRGFGWPWLFAPLAVLVVTAVFAWRWRDSALSDLSNRHFS